MSTDSNAAPSADQETDAVGDGDGLVSRLRVIEDQPLEARAEAYTALHSELKAVLDSADRVGADRAGADRVAG